MEWFFDHVILMGMGLCLAQAAVYLGRPIDRKLNRLFALLFGLLFFIQLGIRNVNDDLTLKVIHLAEIDLPFLYAIGPTLWFLGNRLLVQNQPGKKQPRQFEIWHWIPAMLAVAVLATGFYPLPAAEKQLDVQHQFDEQPRNWLVAAVFLGGMTSAIGYTLLLVWQLRMVWSVNAIKREPVLRLIVLISTADISMISARLLPRRT